jgi:hypothetical protein
VPKLVTTKPGAKLACVITSFGAAKERKRTAKAMKGTLLTSLSHHSAHLLCMKLIDVTDDTVNVQKTLLEEIRKVNGDAKYKADGTLIQGTNISPLVNIACDKFGRKFLMRLLNPGKKNISSYLPLSHVAVSMSLYQCLYLIVSISNSVFNPDSYTPNSNPN